MKYCTEFWDDIRILATSLCVVALLYLNLLVSMSPLHLYKVLTASKACYGDNFIFTFLLLRGLLCDIARALKKAPTAMQKGART
jgi:hypothetical protein